MFELKNNTDRTPPGPQPDWNNAIKMGIKMPEDLAARLRYVAHTLRARGHKITQNEIITHCLENGIHYFEEKIR